MNPASEPYFWIPRSVLDPILTETLGKEPPVFSRLKTLAALSRINALSALKAANHGWLGATFSCLDLLTLLYHVFIPAPERPLTERHSLVLSKGHGVLAQYAILAGLGAFPLERLAAYKTPRGLPAHCDRAVPGIDADSGSLGQGLSKAIGITLANRSRDAHHLCFTILGDGEMQEGQVFESLLTHKRLDLWECLPILDRNRLQSDSTTADIKDAQDWEKVFRGIGLQVLTISGHNLMEIYSAVQSVIVQKRPTIIIANTFKGWGTKLTCMAHETERRQGIWHGRIPTDAEYAEMLLELAENSGVPEVLALAEAFVATRAAETNANASASANVSATANASASANVPETAKATSSASANASMTVNENRTASVSTAETSRANARATEGEGVTAAGGATATSSANACFPASAPTSVTPPANPSANSQTAPSSATATATATAPETTTLAAREPSPTAAASPTPLPTNVIPPLSTGAAFGNALVEARRQGRNVWVLSADLEKACRLTEFAQAFPERFLEVGISEQDLVSIGAGIGLGRGIAVVNTYGSFFKRALDQICTAGMEGVPLILAGHYSGLDYFTDGKSHQSLNDIALLRAAETIDVFEPLTPAETQQCLFWLLERMSNEIANGHPSRPAYVRLHRSPTRVPLPLTQAFEPGGLHRFLPSLIPTGHASSITSAVSDGQRTLNETGLVHEKSVPLPGESACGPESAGNTPPTIVSAAASAPGKKKLPKRLFVASPQLLELVLEWGTDWQRNRAAVEVIGISSFLDPQGDLKRLLAEPADLFSLESHVGTGGLSDFLRMLGAPQVETIAARPFVGSARSFADTLAEHGITRERVETILFSSDRACGTHA